MKVYVIIIDTNTGWKTFERVFTSEEEAELYAKDFNVSESLSNDEDPFYEMSTALVRVVEI